MFTDFVKQYKVLLTMRQTHPSSMRLSFWLQSLVMLVLLLSIGLFVGVLTGALGSFNYLFLWVQVTFVVTTLLMIDRKALILWGAHQHAKTRKTVLVVEGSMVLSRWLLASTIVYGVFLLVVGQAWVLAVLLVMSLSVTGVLLGITLQESPHLMRETVLLAAVLALMHMALLVLMPIGSVSINYLVTATLLALALLALEQTSEPLYGKTVKGRLRVNVATGVLVIAVFGFVMTGRVRMMTWFHAELNVIETVTLPIVEVDRPHIDRHPRMVYPDGDRIIMVEHEVIAHQVTHSLIQVYERSGGHLATVPYPEIGVTHLLSNSGFYLQITRHPDCFLLEPCDVENFDHRVLILYRLKTDQTFEKLVFKDLPDPLSYVVEEAETLRLFAQDDIGVFDLAEGTITWHPLATHAHFRYQDARRYFWLEPSGVVYTNMVPPSGQPTHVFGLPFFEHSVLSYYDGYQVGYVGDPNDHDVYLLDLTREKVVAVENLSFMPYVFLVDQERILTFVGTSWGLQRPFLTASTSLSGRMVELPYDLTLTFNFDREGVFAGRMDEDALVLMRLNPEQIIQIRMRTPGTFMSVDLPVLLILGLAGFVYPAWHKKRWSTIVVDVPST